MPDETFSLPSSSFAELTKIIKAYAHLGADVELDSLSSLTGIARTTISSNNKFLAAAGLIKGGNKKSCTELGTQLGRALDHNRASEAKVAWTQSVTGSEFLANLITTVRLKGGMTVDELASHIMFASGLQKRKRNATGARAVVDILIDSGLLSDQGDQLSVAAPTADAQTVDTTATSPATPPGDAPESSAQELAEGARPESQSRTEAAEQAPVIAINIQLQIPPVNDPEIYENLFSSLRKHLLNPDD